jgi:nucleoside-diphosphate-sugar epimerase
MIRIPLGLTRLAAYGGDAAGTLFGMRTLINSRRYVELASEGFVCRVDRLREHLGVVAQIGLRDGLADALAWYVTAGWL